MIMNEANMKMNMDFVFGIYLYSFVKIREL